MRARNVADVNIITYARTIRRFVIIAEDTHCGVIPSSCEHERNQMRFGIMGLAAMTKPPSSGYGGRSGAKSSRRTWQGISLFSSGW
jgi:hypothetical protein